MASDSEADERTAPRTSRTRRVPARFNDFDMGMSHPSVQGAATDAAPSSSLASHTIEELSPWSYPREGADRFGPNEEYLPGNALYSH